MDIEQAVRGFIRDQLQIEGSSLGPDDSFLEKAILDSTGIVELVTFLEDQFSITVADEEITPENLDTLRRIGEFVSRKCQTDGITA